MKRLALGAVGFALVLALAAAAVFAIWPVVGDAPWLATKRTGPSDVNLLSWDQVVDAVSLRAAMWCRDRQARDANECATTILGGPECETHDPKVWDVYYLEDRHIWKATCGGHVFLVDDNTGQASSPYLP